jgi:hypothetical protein
VQLKVYCLLQLKMYYLAQLKVYCLVHFIKIQFTMASYPEGRSSRFLQTCANFPPNYTTSHLRRPLRTSKLT